jgi:hypothetical protein
MNHPAAEWLADSQCDCSDVEIELSGKWVLVIEFAGYPIESS